jgi:hypothetical protein
MTTARDPRTRIVLSWLREDAYENAERVLLRALDEVDATPQRRPFWRAWRSSNMNNPVRLAIAAAAVLVVATIGYQLLPSRTGGPGAPTAAATLASPSPTSAPTTAPTESEPRGLPFSGAISPGRYAINWQGNSLVYEMPAGWFAYDGHSVFKGTGAPPLIAWSADLPGSRYEPTHVYTDACRSEGALAPIGPTVDDLVQALDGQLGTDATVTDVMFDGRVGKRVELVESPGVDRATCRHGAEGPLQIYADVAETGFFALGPGHRGAVVILDVGGQRVVVTSTWGPQASRADRAELDGITDSISFEP